MKKFKGIDLTFYSLLLVQAFAAMGIFFYLIQNLHNYILIQHFS